MTHLTDRRSSLRPGRPWLAPQIRKAWRKLSLLHHPDKLAQRGISATEETAAQFRRLKDAHGVLSDPARRGTYDR